MIPRHDVTVPCSAVWACGVAEASEAFNGRGATRRLEPWDAGVGLLDTIRSTAHKEARALQSRKSSRHPVYRAPDCSGASMRDQLAATHARLSGDTRTRFSGLLCLTCVRSVSLFSFYC